MRFTNLAICFALALVLAASAQQVEDNVVPESTQEVEPMELVDTSADENSAAHQDAKLYLQKAGSDACKALADSTEKAVKDNIKAEQAILDKIDKGAKCHEEGQDAVKAMETKLKEAEEAKKKADGAYSDAMSADVHFGKRKYNTLTKGSCGTFFDSSAYKNAESKVASTKKTKDKAAGKVTEAKNAVSAAKTAAAKAVKKCQCDTAKTHEKALAAANKSVESANSKSWTKAAHLKCVLAGTPYTSCKVPALPKVKATSVANGVSKDKCAKPLTCKTNTKSTNSAGNIHPAHPGAGYSLVGGGMHNGYRNWNAHAGFENMYPSNGKYYCDMGFGAGVVKCYATYCKSVTCTTASARAHNVQGSKTAKLPAGYTMTGGGIYNYYRHFNSKSLFEQSRPDGETGWLGDMGAGVGDWTTHVIGCKGISCVTKNSQVSSGGEIKCPTGYTVTGCGMQNGHGWGKLGAFEDIAPRFNGCYCDSGFGTGKNVCYARCCRTD